MRIDEKVEVASRLQQHGMITMRERRQHCRCPLVDPELLLPFCLFLNKLFSVFFYRFWIYSDVISKTTNVSSENNYASVFINMSSQFFLVLFFFARQLGFIRKKTILRVFVSLKYLVHFVSSWAECEVRVYSSVLVRVSNAAHLLSFEWVWLIVFAHIR